MPFDPTFTPEEAEAAITADPKLIERLTPALTKLEWVVRDKATNTTYEKGLLESNTATLQKQIAESTEKEIFDSTGIKKADGETWDKFNARVLKALKGEATAKETELATLRGKSDVTAVERAKMKELEDSIGKLNDTHKADKATWQEQLTKAQTHGTVSAELATIRQSYLKAIPESVAKIAEQAAINEIVKSAKLEGDVIIYINADGTPQRDPVTMMPLTTADKLKAALKDLIDPGFKQGGAGSGNRAGNDPAGVTPDGITTKVQLTEFLLKQKGGDGKLLYPSDSPEFIKEFNKLGGAKLPLR